jgi:subtilisin family serine protease
VNRFLAAASACAALALTICPSAAGATAADRAEPLASGVIVQYAAGADRSDRAAARADADVTFERTLGDPDFQLVELEPDQPVAAALDALRADPAVVAADANGYSTLDGIPNDPLFGSLWGMTTIDAPTAWDVTVGSPSVVVAVIDSGHRFDHPDLAAITTTNGRDFVGPYSDVPYPGDADPTDENAFSGGHGTHVAGTIGAAGNNGIGVTGVGQNLRLMPLRVCSYSQVSQGVICPFHAQIAAINYAGANGARVANMSLGGTGFDQTVVNAIAANPHVLYVISAGNENANNNVAPRYPCSYAPQLQSSPVPAGAIDNIVCVAATTQTDQRASFSNYGSTTVDLGAPGDDILSTYPQYSYAAGISFFDDFETADFDTAWTDSGANGGFDRSTEQQAGGSGITDSHGAAPIAGQQRASTSVAVELQPGYESCTLSYARLLNLTGGATFTYSVILDGTTLDSFSPTVAAANTYTRTVRGPTLSGGGDLQIRFQFASGASPTAATGVWLDDVELDCFDPGATQLTYGPLDGTSMASPHVAGAAGLLFSRNPGIGVAQARSALLQSVDPIPALNGITTTGGRLDVAKALALIPPPAVISQTSPPPPAAPKPRCKVPKLKGLSKGKAKKALEKANCKLGKVTKPRAKKGQKLPPLIVKSSKPKAGTEHDAGKKVAVTLGPKPKPRKKR